MLVKCKNCGKETNRSPSAIRNVKNVFCSRNCAGKFNMTGKIRGAYSNNKSGLGKEERSEKYIQARDLRKDNYGYRSISKIIGISWKTIRGWVKDIKVDRKKTYRRSMDMRMASSSCDLKNNESVRKFLTRTRGYVCSSCHLSVWMGKKIMLEVHHINGDSEDQRDDNVTLLCPNCHSLTPNWRNKKRQVGQIGFL